MAESEGVEEIQKIKLRVGGVPEHFNAPWYIACEERDFEQRPYDVEWTDFPGGTGAMCQALAEEEIDVAVLLADGIISAILSGHSARIIGTYVDSPLYWGIHVHASTPFQKPEELAGHPFAISRFGSGSHLMTFVEAHGRGWLEEHKPEFVPVGGLEGAREAMEKGEAVGFLWERLMTRPLVDAGEWRQIGVRPSPWPAFLIAARPEVIAQHGELIHDMLTVVQRRCHDMKAARGKTRAYIAKNFGLEPGDIDAWLDETRWRCAPEVASNSLEDAVEMLYGVGVIERRVRVEELVATSICELGEVLPEALYDLRVGGVRDALSRAGRAFGLMTYEQLNALGDFDRYYDYGTESCQKAAHMLGIRDGRTVLEIGSRVGAAARFLAHHYGCMVTGVEVQPALNAVARELTARCGMSRQVRFMSGDIASMEVDGEAVDHFISLMVMLHLPDRVPAWRRCHHALKPGGTFLVEDLIIKQPLSEEHQELASAVLKAPNLVSIDAYIDELEQGGLVDVVARDLTESWRQWTTERYEQFLAERDLHVSIHGAEVFESRRVFLQIMRDFFEEGLLGGARFTGRRRGVLEEHLVAARSAEH